MKHIIVQHTQICLLFLLGICLSTTAWSQDDDTVSKWKLFQAGARVSVFSQMHGGLQYGQIQNKAKDPKFGSVWMDDLILIYNDPNSGEAIGGTVSWQKRRSERTSDVFTVGLDYYSFSELYVEYKPSFTSADYVAWCLAQTKRFEIDFKYLRDLRKGRFGGRVGPSLGFSSSFDDDVILLTSYPGIEQAQTAGKGSQYLGAHINAHFYAVLFQRIEVGIGGRAGGGLQLNDSRPFSSFNAHFAIGYRL